jgi:hypothetical protein
MLNMVRRKRRSRLTDKIKPHGLVEILVYRRGILIDRVVEKNLILFQGNSQIIQSLCNSPTTTPRIINRMAIGDQGTIPSDPTVPKVPTQDLTGLYHEVYRKDVDSRTLTTNPSASFNITGTLVIGDEVVNTISTSGIAPGMSVVGTGVSIGTVVEDVTSDTQFILSEPAVAPGGSQVLTISGAANQCQFVAAFAATDVPTSAFSNPSAPVINEVGLVIINPTAVSGIARAPVIAPALPASDEVLMSIRTYNSVPFLVASDVSVTIRYTIFLA